MLGFSHFSDGMKLTIYFKNIAEGTIARYFMVRYCTVDGMVLETCILSNTFCVGVCLHSLRLKMATGV